MAKKKAPKRKHEKVIDLADASIVSERVGIKSVSIIESKTVRPKLTGFSPKGMRLVFKTGDVALEIEERENDHRLVVYIDFSVIAYRDDLVGPEASRTSQAKNGEVEIACKIAVMYSLASIEGLAERNFVAFAYSNGIFNAWSYWREFVQSSSVRMGLPPIMTPVFRLQPQKEEHGND